MGRHSFFGQFRKVLAASAAADFAPDRVDRMGQLHVHDRERGADVPACASDSSTRRHIAASQMAVHCDKE